jgi:hypothetical protein
MSEASPHQRERRSDSSAFYERYAFKVSVQFDEHADTGGPLTQCRAADRAPRQDFYTPTEAMQPFQIRVVTTPILVTGSIAPLAAPRRLESGSRSRPLHFVGPSEANVEMMACP